MDKLNAAIVLLQQWLAQDEAKRQAAGIQKPAPRIEDKSNGKA